MQVMTLRQLLRAVEMAKTATPQDDSRTQRIEQAILEFLDTVVVKASDAGKASGFKLARDALEHFDEYYRGTGPFSSRASSGVTAALTRPSPRTTGSIWKVPQTVRCGDVAECNCTRGIVGGRLA
jgi:hypothetical protein